MNIKSKIWYSVKREIKYIFRDIKQELYFTWEDICIWLKENQQLFAEFMIILFLAIILTVWIMLWLK